MYGIDEDEIAIVFTPEIVERMYHRICWVLNEGILAGFSVFDQMKEFKARESLFKAVAKNIAEGKVEGTRDYYCIEYCKLPYFSKEFFKGKKLNKKRFDRELKKALLM